MHMQIVAVEKENKPANTNKAPNATSVKAAPTAGKPGAGKATTGASNQNGQQPNNRSERVPREG